ncbi:hypothetical protein LQK80_03725 [Bacillus thuringiensis]|nr:hypothetical protein [Bacillus thuringiensis]
MKIDCITPRHVMDYQNKMINEYSAEYLKNSTLHSQQYLILG